MAKLFVLPNVDSLLENFDIHEKVVVVSIIGKTDLNSHGLKIKSIGRIFTSNKNRNSECTIDGFFDEDNQIIYLHVHTLLDTDAFIEHYDAISQRCKELHDNDDFLVVYSEVKSRFARALLFVFYTSHIVILSHVGHNFDLNYVQYFKAVDALRHSLFEDVQELLENVEGLSKEWIKSGRMCTPRLIFYFEKCPKNVVNIKKLEHNIEDQIYQVLRKSRIISNSSASTLFTIPPNDEYAYVNTDVCVTPLTHAVRALMGGCEPGAGGVRVTAPFCDQAQAQRSFQRFLRVHVRQARNAKGFDDVVVSSSAATRHGQTVVAPHFELPTIGHWANVAKSLYNLIVTAEPVKSLCTETQFSQQRCLKVLPIALAKYQEAIPSHYGETVHKARLAHALAVFGAQARGPLFAQYERRLEADCTAYWAAGVRQACEAPSLSGRGCELPRHTSDVPHCSGGRRVAACDCGRMQATRDDPYTAKQANYTFYHQLSKDCTCFSLERMQFPIFQPSGPEYGPADLSQYQISAPASTTQLKLKLEHGSKDAELDLEQQQQQPKQQVDLKDEVADAKTDDKPEEQFGVMVKSINLSASDSESDKVVGGVRPLSTTEYLPGMYTLSSPAHLLPTFSSWSLVCLGPSSVYSHNQGLPEGQQPGFLPTTNYLLPWDKQVQYKQPRHQQQYHHYHSNQLSGDVAPSELILTAGRKKLVKTSTGSRSHFTVKVFVGVEYECPKGHRFMLAGPDRVLRAAPGSLVTDTAHRLVDSDMPLYYPCPCRPSATSTAQPSVSTATATTTTTATTDPPPTQQQQPPPPLLAQLMRLHVVTPKAPVTVTLAPRVQPAHGAPVFVPPPGLRELRLTQSTYWVLRLPYMYVDERARPVVGDAATGRLLKVVFAVRRDWK